MFIACSEDSSSEVMLENQVLQKSRTVVSYEDVVNSLHNMRAKKLEDYSDPYPPLFNGYDRIEYYRVDGDSNVYVLYVFDNPSNPNVATSQQQCTKSWNSGDGVDEGCYDHGSDCDVELRNGQFIVICCDDPVA